MLASLGNFLITNLLIQPYWHYLAYSEEDQAVYFNEKLQLKVFNFQDNNKKED